MGTDNSRNNVASLVKYRSKEKLTVHAGVAAAALLQRCHRLLVCREAAERFGLHKRALAGSGE